MEVLKDEPGDSKLIRCFKAFVRARSPKTAAKLQESFNSTPVDERGVVFSALTSTQDVLASASSSGITKELFDSCHPLDEQSLQEETMRELLLGSNVGAYVLVKVLFETVLDGKGKVKVFFFFCA